MAEALNSLFKAECIRNPVMRPQGRVGVGPRRRDRGRRIHRLVQPPAPARRDRTRPARRVRGRPLGIPQARQLRWRTGSRQSRFQITEPPRNPGRFTQPRGVRTNSQPRRNRGMINKEKPSGKPGQAPASFDKPPARSTAESPRRSGAFVVSGVAAARCGANRRSDCGPWGL